MLINKTLQIIKPAPDSQYRLRPCRKCAGTDVAYVQYEGDGRELWRVQCFTCNHTGQGHEARHDAQVDWNEEVGE